MSPRYVQVKQCELLCFVQEGRPIRGVSIPRQFQLYILILNMKLLQWLVYKYARRYVHNKFVRFECTLCMRAQSEKWNLVVSRCYAPKFATVWELVT